MNAAEQCCHVCGVPHPQALAGMEQFVPISSDIRVVDGRLVLMVCEACGVLQKQVDLAWRESVRRVYEGYAINHQSGGADPAIFNSLYGAGPRASILIKHLTQTIALKPQGRMLDIGCASGNILRAFGAAHPGWALHGLEHNDQWRSDVMQIPNVQGFYNDLDEVVGVVANEHFDLIVMSHVLEHISDPAAYLARLRRHLSVDGVLYVAVPDIRQNPIDLVVLDHCTHFDTATLGAVLTRGGFATRTLRGDVLGKEIIALSRPGVGSLYGEPPYKLPLKAVAEKYLALCRSLAEQARRLRTECATLGVMGTSTAAAWIAGELGLQVDFYVDEDPQRIGKTLFERPIYSLADIPPGARLFIPMSAKTAQGIITRANRPDVCFEYHPENQIDDVLQRAGFLAMHGAGGLTCDGTVCG